jgi:Disulfide bond chaperones of the HSP33 family
MSATLMMGSNLKNEEVLSVTINGGGPIGTIITTTNGKGDIKGFVANPDVHYTYNDTGKLAVGIAVGNQGYLQVVRDMGLKEPFSSQVALQTGEIGDDFTYYYAVSEQTPSAVSLGVLVNENNEVIASGGFIIQLMPEATNDDIKLVETALENCKPVTELIKDGLTPEAILNNLFSNVELLDKQELKYFCNCSKDQMTKALLTIGSEELNNMIKEDHGCEIKCHFCNTKYIFNEEELTAMIETL